jgi:voltage-gated potassium channel
MTALRRLRLSLALLAAVVAGGTLGYVGLEGYSLLDALYMTVITLTTVGYGEVHPLSPAGRGFTIGLIAVGLGVVSSVVGSGLELLFGEQFREVVGRQRMERRLQEIRDHCIVCGFGRMGQEIAREFQARRVPFVVIERDPVRAAELAEAEIPHVVGDASEDEVLHRAGVERARSLVTVAPTDADNIFITLTGRSLNPRLRIVARSAREEDEHKLRRAGADRVISPYVIGARRIAAAVYRPEVVDFLDIHTLGTERELELDNVPITAQAPYAGQKLRDSGIRERTGCTVLALRSRGDGAYENNPGPDRVLQVGDTMIVLGATAQLDALKRLNDLS